MKVTISDILILGRTLNLTEFLIKTIYLLKFVTGPNLNIGNLFYQKL